MGEGQALTDPEAATKPNEDLDDPFLTNLTRVVTAIRNNAMTALVNSPVTMENLLGNIGAYADHHRNRGVLDLKDAAKGRPGIVVSAGPSLTRNYHLLREALWTMPVAAVQTVLKFLLGVGIRPHYVCAIDYHEISGRFYEGLTARDVECVHLVVAAGAHPIIARTWPGVYRMPGDSTLDLVLNSPLSAAFGSLPASSTVALACYHLCRYMGCDPIILVGQDFAYSDWQYYHGGAAIHEVWAGELNGFNTVEMMELQRISRDKGNRVTMQDVLGRDVPTDQLLMTYLVAMNEQIAQDLEAGLSVVDATEGGIPKQGAEVMTLREALDKFTPKDRWKIRAVARPLKECLT